MARPFPLEAAPQSGISASGPETALPPLPDLLCAGGDGRIARDGAEGANRYGCAPWPDAEVAAFGSATASTVSPRGFTAASALRDRLNAALLSGRAPDEIYEQEMARLRRDLAQAIGLGASGPETTAEILFAASGTDLHLLAAELVLGGAGTSSSARPLAIMVAAAETGRGVPEALGKRHFDRSAALGAKVEAGAAIGAEGPEIAALQLRMPNGGVRDEAALEGEVAALAAAAVKEGRQVLLVLADLTKTGLIAPAPDFALSLRRRYPGRVEILIDACQFRLGAATLKAYLEAECLVALTGSKFLTGPAFSGALLLPRGAIDRQGLARRRLTSGLAAYSARADWPDGFAAGADLPAAANFGLALRWEAALAELQAFAAVPEAMRTAFFRRFAAAVTRRLETDPAFVPLPGRAIERGTLAGPAAGWDRVPTIFPFLLRKSGADRAGRLLEAAEMAAVHRLIAQPVHGAEAIRLLTRAAGTRTQGSFVMRCQLGQPVACGATEAGRPLAALRLCASARLAVEAAAGGAAELEDRTEAILARALAALDRTAAAARIVARTGTGFSTAIFS